MKKIFISRWVIVFALMLSFSISAIADACLQLPVGCKVTSAFGIRYDPVKKDSTSQYHAGMDFGCPSGTAVMAAAPGLVAVAGFSKSAGQWIVIKAPGGRYTFKYMHNTSLLVTGGQMVNGGKQISFSGNTGQRTTGPHLHFQVEDNGKMTNPYPMFCAQPELRPGVLMGAPSGEPGDTHDDVRSATPPSDNGGIPPKIGFEGSLDEVLADLIASRAMNPDYMAQLEALSVPRLYAELAYMQAVSLKIRNEHNATRERTIATLSMIQILRAESVLRPQLDSQRAAATRAAVSAK